MCRGLRHYLNWNYNIWFFVMFTLWFWQGFAREDHKLRQHFLLGFTLTWFVGTCGLGTILSSVGPCFYGRLLPSEADPYVPLMSWLKQVNQTHAVFALDVMDELWKNYETGKGLVNGISAMPSMHVGTSILFAILGVRLRQALARLAAHTLRKPDPDWLGTSGLALRHRWICRCSGRSIRLVAVRQAGGLGPQGARRLAQST